MKIVNVDSCPPIIGNSEKPELYIPTFELTVIMTQEEYELCCYYLQKEKRMKK